MRPYHTFYCDYLLPACVQPPNPSWPSFFMLYIERERDRKREKRKSNVLLTLFVNILLYRPTYRSAYEQDRLCALDNKPEAAGSMPVRKVFLCITMYRGGNWFTKENRKKMKREGWTPSECLGVNTVDHLQATLLPSIFFTCVLRRSLIRIATQVSRLCDRNYSCLL